MKPELLFLLRVITLCYNTVLSKSHVLLIRMLSSSDTVVHCKIIVIWLRTAAAGTALVLAVVFGLLCCSNSILVLVHGCYTEKATEAWRGPERHKTYHFRTLG